MAAIVIALLILLGLVLWLLVEPPWVNSRIPSPQHETAHVRRPLLFDTQSHGSTTPRLPRSRVRLQPLF